MASHAAASHAAGDHSSNRRYFVPAPSAWPFMLTIALGTILYSVSMFLEERHPGPIPFIVGGLLFTGLAARREARESYAMDAIRKDLEIILEKEDIELGGLEIITTIDLRIQQRAIGDDAK